MKRGDIYRVYYGAKNDPREQRVFVIVSRQELIDNSFSTIICAPVYSKSNNLSTQVEIGIDEGLKHDSYIYCDNLASLQKSLLTNYIGKLSAAKMGEVNEALRVALAV